MNFCACGCGEKTKGGKFKSGHNLRIKNPMSDPEIRLKVSKSHIGKIITEETKQKMSESQKGRKHTEETRKKMSENNTRYWLGKKGYWTGKKRDNISGDKHPFYNKERSEETKDKISNKLKGIRQKTGEDHHSWKGGSYNYWHNQAWKKFGKMYCEICHININEHYRIYNDRFDMHNTLEPKDYTCLESHAWKCVCHKCHLDLDFNNKKNNK